MTDERLIDIIYEAAVVPGCWQKALGAVAASVGAKGGLIVAGDHERVTWLASPALEAIYHSYLAGGWHRLDDRLARLRASGHAGFVAGADLHSQEERASLPLFTQFLTPQGVDTPVGTAIGGLAKDDVQVSFEAFATLEASRAALPALDLLRPHLARAALLTARLGLERAQVAAETLAELGAAAAVLGERRRLIAANALFEARLDRYYHDTPGGLRLADGSADRQLGVVLGALARGNRRGSGSGSLPISGVLGEARLVMHVLPIRGAARDIFAPAVAILVIAVPGQRGVPGADLIQALLDLTPAEARLAHGLAAGSSLAEVAQASGIQQSTARNQMKSIFCKTGLSRQADLVSLLASVAPPGGKGFV